MKRNYIELSKEASIMMLINVSITIIMMLSFESIIDGYVMHPITVVLYGIMTMVYLYRTMITFIQLSHKLTVDKLYECRINVGISILNFIILILILIL